MIFQNTLSKSQFIQGFRCHKNLWLQKNRKDLIPNIVDSNAIVEAGKEIGEIAKQYFPNGKEIKIDNLSISELAKITTLEINTGTNVLFEATAYNPTSGINARIDILQRHKKTDKWNLIEVKSSAKVKDHQLIDISFQYYVFTKCGYNIEKCYIMYPDKEYKLEDEFNVNKFFKFDDLTTSVIEKQIILNSEIKEMLSVMNNDSEIKIPIGQRCFTPFVCGYKDYCWSDVPDYSVFSVYNKKKAEKMYEKYGFDIHNIPEKDYPKGSKRIELLSHIRNETMIDISPIRDFINQIIYPIYYLDYETIMSGVPVVPGTKSFQQIPFQFSLHIQNKDDDNLNNIQHKEFLHDKNSDPRPDFIRNLIDYCGQIGTILVYNKTFEISRNNELIHDFPEYSDELNNINERIIDLFEPFRKRNLYSPKQHGSASIKYVLPAFTESSYSALTIKNGGDASNIYKSYFINKFDNTFKQTKEDLLKYCKLDTYSMVLLFDVLIKQSSTKK
jgi:hypothetical protein